MMQNFYAVFGLLLSLGGKAVGFPSSHSAGRSEKSNTPAKLFYPSGLAIGETPSLETSTYHGFTLTELQPLATLDYGYEVGGLPIFDVLAINGTPQIEVKYSEPFTGLAEPYSDGPYTFVIGLMNTFRVETFNVTEPGLLSSFLLQGGLRWQSIRLLTGGSISFGQVGLTPTFEPAEVTELPGQFHSSNKLYDDIWKLGARAVTAACVLNASQPAVWRVTEEGAYMQSLRPALSSVGFDFGNYTLNFSAKIARGGTGWAVAEAETEEYGLNFYLIGELPEESTFVNTNRSLTPPNSVIVGYGWSPMINQTTLIGYPIGTFEVPFSVHENQWYNISTQLTGSGSLSVSIDGTKTFSLSLYDYYLGDGVLPPNSGSFGFGAYQDHETYIKDVTVIADNSSLLYENAMTDESILEEYGVHENYGTMCLDGPKRDRMGWLGDFYHTSKIISSSTSRADYIKGSLENFIASQASDGQFNIDVSLGWPPSITANRSSTALNDYQQLGLLGFAHYILDSNDIDFALATWPAWEHQIDYILSTINSTTGLPSVIYAFLGPASGSSAVSCLTVQSLSEAAKVAIALNYTTSASKYVSAATELSSAINAQLWNDDLGIYSLSPDYPEDFSVAAMGFCISSGVANQTQAEAFLKHLSELQAGVGYADSTEVNITSTSTQISPNTNGFLLPALFEVNTNLSITAAKFLLDNLWASMVVHENTTTGASWEYTDTEGNPGLSLFTSLSHPWGGAPTYVFMENVIGLKPVEMGWKTWTIEPKGWQLGEAWLGLDSISGHMPTPYGTIEVSWNICHESKTMDVTVLAPRGTIGDFILNNASGNQSIAINGGKSVRFMVRL